FSRDWSSDVCSSDLDDVFALAQSGRRRRVLAGLGQSVDVPDKPIETAGGKRVKLAGPAPERKEVGFSLAATGQRRDEVEITGLEIGRASWREREESE